MISCSVLFWENAAHSAQVRRADGGAGRFVSVPRVLKAGARSPNQGGEVVVFNSPGVRRAPEAAGSWARGLGEGSAGGVLKTWEGWELLVGFR